MILRLSLLLVVILTPLSGQAQNRFSLPGIGQLEKSFADNKESDSSNEQKAQQEPPKELLAFRREIKSNRQRIDELKKTAEQAPTLRARLTGEIATLRQQAEQQWQQQYQTFSLDKLVETLLERLDALEENQHQLADVNSQLTHARTLPEQARRTISQAMDRTATLRRRLNQAKENGDETTPQQEDSLQTELKALESRIERSNQELAAMEVQQDLARLRQQKLQRQERKIKAQLDALQPLINERRSHQLQQVKNNGGHSLPETVSQNKSVQAAIQRNQDLREQVASTSESVNGLLREAIDTKTQLDKARSLSTTVNDQIRLLDGSLLLSRVLYKQQKSLPRVPKGQDLQKRLSDTRLLQFDFNQKRDALTTGSLPEAKKAQNAPPEVESALHTLRSERLELYNQLDRELGRKLAILSRTQLNRSQLRELSRDLQDTISEQTFWMPSTQPVSLEWLMALPGQLSKQLRNTPWQDLTQPGAQLLRQKWPWFLLALAPALLMLACKPVCKRRIQTINQQIGFLRQDSQAHTPMGLIYTLLRSSPAPIFLAILGAGFWLQSGTLNRVLGVALAKLALMWLVFELVYRLLKQDGIAQRHFRWDPEKNRRMRRRLSLTGLAALPMVLVVAFGEQWPAQLSEDRLGLLVMIAALAVAAASLPSVAHTYPSRHYNRALRWLATLICGAVPLTLIGLILAGYYYTAVRLTGHLLDSVYLLVLWILLDAIAVRGLAVAAQRLAYRRVIAQREENSDNASNSSNETVEVEEPQLDLKQVNQQSLRLIRLALIAGVALLLYASWTDVFSAFSYTENIMLWETTQGSGSNAHLAAISLGDVMTALAVAVTTFLLASNLPGLLEVLILSRLTLRPGTSYATTTLLSYAIMVTGLVLILGALGLGWQKMQWLVAALGVGLGFGLQEIFANFISGIILLFERPIRIGDIITINDLSGTVSRIRIRATTIIDFDRKEIVVPNKVFVTERLINWSLSDTVTRVVITLGFAHGSDLTRCRQILFQAAEENPLVLRDPEPQVFFLNYTRSALEHDLRVHVDDIGDRLPVTHALNSRIDQLCSDAGIRIAFSQLDVHLHNYQGDELHIGSTTTQQPEDTTANAGENKNS